LTTFRHSGKLGDIVYSLPTVRALGGGVFCVDHVAEYLRKSPLGLEAARLMIELLETQDYIQHAQLYAGGPVDYDLDRFRNKAIPIHVFNSIRADTDEIAGTLFGGFVKEFRRRLIPRIEIDLAQFHWESTGLPGHVDLSIPWITGIQKKVLADVVVSKTSRYFGTFNWSALKEYAPRAVFLGLETEWHDFRSAYFDIDFYKVSSLVDFARVVAGARLYVGNQSFGLALADAMLIPRVAELWDPSPNRRPAINGHHVLTRDVVETYIGL
jgi:hypothetical protein